MRSSAAAQATIVSGFLLIRTLILALRLSPLQDPALKESTQGKNRVESSILTDRGTTGGGLEIYLIRVFNLLLYNTSTAYRTEPLF